MSKQVSQIALLAAMAVSAGILVSAAPSGAEAGERPGCKLNAGNSAHFCEPRMLKRVVKKKYGYVPPTSVPISRMNFGPSEEDLPGRTVNEGGNAGGSEGGGGGGGGGGGAGNKSDIRLKRDIQAIGTLANGLTLYKFKYLWSDTDMVGVMAQEVLNVMPDAVITGEDGFYRVNYDKLGISMMTFDEWKTLVAELDKLPSAA